MTCTYWKAEVLEDPEVRRLLLELLDEGERADYEQRLYGSKHGHSIVLDHGGEHGRCGACGEPFRSDEMAAVPQDANDVAYCFACTSKVYEAMKAAQD